MNNITFKERIYEIAFGDDAINKEYTNEEVIARILEFSNLAYKYKELEK